MSVIVVATGNLVGPGGSESYVMTVAEHLMRLGHSVHLLARKTGVVAQAATNMGISVRRDPALLPRDVDIVFSLDREFALVLGSRYPRAARIFVMHNVGEAYLPPPVGGCVQATVVLNARHEQRAEATQGAGRVIRLRQPIDTSRFSPRQPLNDHPRRVVLLGNYGGFPGDHRRRLVEAWGKDIEWLEVGGENATMDVPAALADVDVVVGYGRSILEAMACARAAYVFEHVGSAGWVTADTYAAMEADGFAGVGVRGPADVVQLRGDLKSYSPELGWQGRDLVRQHHDAREHAAELVILASDIQPQEMRVDEQQLEALAALARVNLLLAEIASGGMIHAQITGKQTHDLHRQLEEMERSAALLEDEAASLRTRCADLEAAISGLQATRRYRIGAALARPLDLARRHRN